MFDTLFPLIMAGSGLYMVVYAVRMLRAVVDSAKTRETLRGAGDGEVLEIPGTVVGGSQLSSPLQGLPCVWWRVQVTIFRSSDKTRLKTDDVVDVASDADFTVRTDRGEVHVQGRHSTGEAGVATVHRDQGAFSRTMTIEGRSYDIPAVANGSRLVQEGVVQPGQTVWVRGRLSNRPSGAWLTGTEQHPVGVETTPAATRRQLGIGVALLTIVVGVGLLIGAYLYAT